MVYENMRNIIIVLCFFILFSCTKKNTLKTEKNENSPVIVTSNEDLDKKTYIDDLELDYNPQKIIEKRNYSNPLYEYWTLGGRYTTYAYYDHFFKCFKEFRTFINLDGFSDAMIAGNFSGWGSFKDNDTRADDGEIYFFYENNGYYAFREFLVGPMTFSDYYYFNIADDGVIILTREYQSGYQCFKDLEIHYKYQDNEIVLFNYSKYNYTEEYPPKRKEFKIEMTKFINLKNKIILRDYKKNEDRKDNKHDIVYINEDTEDLKSLYIAVLRRKFLSIIDYISGCDDINYLEYHIPGFSTLYFLTKKEVDIFEDCIYEYLNEKNEEEMKEINKEILFDILKKMKKN